jgi:hypothetical protein
MDETLPLPESEIKGTFYELNLGTSAVIGQVLTASANGGATWQTSTGTSGDPFNKNTPTLMNAVPLNIISMNINPSVIVLACGSDYLYGNTDLTNLAIENWFKITTAPVLTAICYSASIGFMGIVASTSTVFVSPDGYSWTVSVVLPFIPASIATNTDTVVVVGNAIVIAGTSNGQIWRTSNGTTWTSMSSGITTNLGKIIYAGNKYVVVGNNGVILYSATGSTWTSVTSGTTNQLLSVMYSTTDTKYIASGASDTLVSTDAITWTSAPIGISSGVRSIATSGSVYIGSESGAIFRSTNSAVTWSAYNCARAMRYNGSVWITCGSNYPGIMRGTTLSNLVPIYIIPGVSVSALLICEYFNNLFIVAGLAGVLYSSADGLTWTSRTSQTSSNTIISSVVGSSVAVFVGAGGKISTTTDGTTYTAQTSGTSTAFSSIAYASGLTNCFCAVGIAGIIYTSTATATTWTARSSGIASKLDLVAASSSMYVTAGTGVILTSTDGVTWTLQNILTNGIGIVNTVFGGLIYDGHQFVLSGTSSGAVWSSVDGATWTYESSIPGIGNIYMYDAGSEYYIALSNSNTAIGLIFGTQTLRGWSILSPGMYGKTNVYYISGKFIISDANGLSISTDGVQWASYIIPSHSFAVANSTAMFIGSTLGTVSMYKSDASLNVLQLGHSSVSMVDIACTDTYAVLVSTLVAYRNSYSGGWTNTWTQTYSAPFGYTITGISQSSSHFVIYGTNGLVVTATLLSGGSTWIEAARVAGTIVDMCWDATLAKFYAINGVGQILSASASGATWTVLNTPQLGIVLLSPKINTNGTGGLLIADLNTTGPPIILQSTNGTTWTTTTAPQSGVSNTSALTVANSIYFIKTGTFDIAYSIDRSTWFYRTLLPRDSILKSVVYLNSKYIVVGSKLILIYS